MYAHHITLTHPQDSSRRDSHEAGKLFPAIRGFAARMRDRAADDLGGLLPSVEGADASLVVTTSTYMLVVLLLWLLDGGTVSFVCGEYFRGACSAELVGHTRVGVEEKKWK